MQFFSPAKIIFFVCFHFFFSLPIKANGLLYEDCLNSVINTINSQKSSSQKGNSPQSAKGLIFVLEEDNNHTVNCDITNFMTIAFGEQDNVKINDEHQQERLGHRSISYRQCNQSIAILQLCDPIITNFQDEYLLLYFEKDNAGIYYYVIVYPGSQDICIDYSIMGRFNVLQSSADFSDTEPEFLKE